MTSDTARPDLTTLSGRSDGRSATLRDSAARSDRRFFTSFAVVLLCTVFAGFSRTYYLNDLASSPFELTPALHWHGAVFTAWMLLLVVQTSLIATGRTTLHRRLGVLGGVLALAMIGLGIQVAISRTASGTIGDQGVPPLLFLAVPVVGMLVFGALVGAAVYFRRQPAIHKRLMMIATLELVTASVSRLPLVETWGPLGFFGVTDLFVAAMVAYDYVTLRRLHNATLWGSLFFVASQPVRLFVGGTSLWLGFAAWLTS
jgi:hypothetical protein